MVSSSQFSIILCIFFVHQSNLIFAKLSAAGTSPAATTSRPRATTTRRSSTTTRRTTAPTSRRPPAAGVDDGVTDAEMKQFTEELLRMDEDDVAHLVTIDTGCTTRCRSEKENAVLVY